MVEFDENGRILPPWVKKSETSKNTSASEKLNPSSNNFWSLYKRKDIESDDDILETRGDKLDPLKFSNGKTQEDVVRETVNAINSGHKIVFIRGVCGSGKSAMALNIAKHFKKTSIVVPIKNLQDQYETDYTNKKFVLKDDGTKLKISVIKGRGNFKCKFNDGETKADDPYLPCTIELREKNWDQIISYIDKNPDLKKEDFTNIKDVRRISVASVCPYWSPLLPAEMGGKILGKARKRKYMSISGKEYALFEREKGCKYYEQYHAYIDADVIIFNATKYMLETAIGRKPKTDLEIIDECDDFLDSFANEKKISLNRLMTAISSLQKEDQKERNAIKGIIDLTNKIISNDDEEIKKLNSHQFKELFDLIMENPHLAEEEDNNYYNNVFESVKSFEDLEDETYVSLTSSEPEQQSLFERSRGKFTTANLVSINLSSKFKSLINQNNALVLMSGTLHSEEVLRDIFGLKNFKIIDAETSSPGEIKKMRVGTEINCKYDMMKNLPNSRERYLRALSDTISKANRPTLVHVTTFSDLPTESEKNNFDIDNIISREEFKKMQEDENQVKLFKTGKIKILFTTRCSRGIDFPGKECNSIILTKYPYSDISGLFWQILKKEKPNHFFKFYLDKANRDLTQRVARGIRFKGDSVYLLSPDSRIFDARIN